MSAWRPLAPGDAFEWIDVFSGEPIEAELQWKSVAGRWVTVPIAAWNLLVARCDGTLVWLNDRGLFWGCPDLPSVEYPDGRFPDVYPRKVMG